MGWPAAGNYWKGCHYYALDYCMGGHFQKYITVTHSKCCIVSHSKQRAHWQVSQLKVHSNDKFLSKISMVRIWNVFLKEWSYFIRRDSWDLEVKLYLVKIRCKKRKLIVHIHKNAIFSPGFPLTQKFSFRKISNK